MRYLLRRVGFYLVALWVAVSFNFIIPRLMPGDPAEAYIAKLQTQQVTRAQIEAIRAEFGVMFNYAARNAILPSVTSFSISLGLVVSGSLLTEIVFNYPGIGFALYKGVQSNDYAMVEGSFLVIALAVLIANFLSELVYVFLDPRVRQGRN